MEVEIRNCTKKTVDAAIIRKAIAETLKLLKIKNDGALSVALVGDKKMRLLNKAWRGKDSATDVLSFGFLEARDKQEEVGEIIICLSVVAKQACLYGLSERKQIARLAAHGTMHIFGLDHERSEKDARKMEEVQDKVLEMLGK